jgi:hypothetical protein
LLSFSQSHPLSAGTSVWIGIGPEDECINTLAIDLIAPTTLYAGTNGSGVFKTRVLDYAIHLPLVLPHR